jgi:isopenicillin N synthase-like dioxygenase
MLEVPVIDLTPYRGGSDKSSVARAVDHACRIIGFLVVSGHGVPDDLTAEMEAVSEEFFAFPTEEKMQVARPASGALRGYIPILQESLARSRGAEAPADLNESLMVGEPDPPDTPYYRSLAAGHHFAPNLWPARPERLRAVWTNYFREMERLATDIMRVFALALDLPEGYFDDKIDRHISRVRVRNYPPPREPPVPGQLRAGAHSDYGSLTILKTQDRPGGLQVLNAAGLWVDVPTIPGSFIVNIGDLMARWTNDRWVSTLHRVVVPPLERTAESQRLSLVFFHNPNYDAMIECVPTCRDAQGTAKFASVSAGEYLTAKFVSAQTGDRPSYVG